MTLTAAGVGEAMGTARSAHGVRAGPLFWKLAEHHLQKLTSHALQPRDSTSR